MDDSGNLSEKIERVDIEDKEITDLEVMKGKETPAAVILNSDDWGFGHFVLDNSSIKVLENNLANLESKIDRAVVITQLVCMMRQVEYPAQRLLHIMHQLEDETNQNLLQTFVKALDQAVESYLPTESIKGFKDEVSEFFLSMA